MARKMATSTQHLSNVVPVRKKNGKMRVCVDYRDLNNVTPKDIYLMHVADLLIDAAAGHEVLSFMDGTAGYHQIPVAEEDRHKTAFRCPGFAGAFEYVVMPFGLKNAGATYQRAMNLIFHDILGKLIEVYIDDVVVKTKSRATHVEDLRASKRHRDPKGQGTGGNHCFAPHHQEGAPTVARANQLPPPLHIKRGREGPTFFTPP
ncbi:hypothetical protein ACLB2K_022032 [Fragaria x ananassa]